MMCDLEQSTERAGLKIHLDKTKIFSNQSSNRRNEVEMLGKQLRFSNQKQQRSKIESWPPGHHSTYKLELTSKSYFLQNRLRLFNMVITPALSHASGTWTLFREHERMIRSTQRKMLRFIVQTKRKNTNKTEPSKNEKDGEGEKESHRRSDEETIEGSSSNTDCTKTATSLSCMILIKKLTQQKLKRKNGLNT